MKTRLFLALVMLSMHIINANGQEAGEIKFANSNVLKLNLTANIIYSPALLVNYERSVNSHQSFSVEAGYVKFPQLLHAFPDSIGISNSRKSNGYKIGGDYRFYFKKENKFDAPHGLYWGPYVAYYHFNNERSFVATDTSFAQGNLDFNAKIQTLHAGVQLGYQFMIKNRLAIDLVLLGPALAYYGFDVKVDGKLNLNEEDELLNDLYHFLVDSFPLLGDLAEEKQISSSGRADLFAGGFRYTVSIGYRF